MIYYYKTTICFDYTNKKYSYCSIVNIKKFHKIEKSFNKLNDLMHKNWGKYNIRILENFILFVKSVIDYLDNFDKNQKYNINMVIHKYKHISI